MCKTKNFGFINEAQHIMEKPKQREKTRQQRRSANLPARFAFASREFFFSVQRQMALASRENSERTQNGAGATPNKNQIHGLQTRWGQAHRVSEICTNELIGGEKQNNSQQHGSEKLMYNGSHLRRSGVLCLSSNKLTSCKGSGYCHKAWVYSP